MTMNAVGDIVEMRKWLTIYYKLQYQEIKNEELQILSEGTVNFLMSDDTREKGTLYAQRPQKKANVQ